MKGFIVGLNVGSWGAIAVAYVLHAATRRRCNLSGPNKES